MAAVPMAIVAVILAIALGFSVNRAGTCSVAAAREVISRGSSNMFAGFALTIGAAGLLTLPLAWALPGLTHLARSSVITAPLLIGAALLGVGAVINGACAFGTLSRLGNGEVRFLAMPAGMLVGFWLSYRCLLLPSPMLSASLFMHPSPAGVMLLAGFAILACVAARVLGPRRGKAGEGSAQDLLWFMPIVGLAGAGLYALAPGPPYGDALRLAAAPSMAMVMTSPLAALASTFAVAGSALGAIVTGRFRVRTPSISGVAHSFSGGLVMAAGANLAGGGNDSFLLSILPSGVVGGAVCYGVMTMTVLGLTAVAGRAPATGRSLSSG